MTAKALSPSPVLQLVGWKTLLTGGETMLGFGWWAACASILQFFAFIQAQEAIYGSALGHIRDQGYSRDQRRLIRYITNMTDRDNRVRPVQWVGQPIQVVIRMNLYQIIDVDERNQFVVIYAWMTQMWQDPSVAWDPSNYSNITMVVLPFTEIWLPDTYLYNNVEMVREESERWINAIVEMNRADPSAALVTFRYPALYKFTCSLDVTYFPFEYSITIGAFIDKQNCTMAFGSWTYDATGIDFVPEKELIAKEDYSESEEWELISFKAYRHLEKYACCPHPFSLLRQHLVIRRKPLHYIVNLIIPTIIISVISTVGFFTPPTTSGERTEKVNLGIATLLAFAILLLMVADQMPSTSRTIPLIGWFLLGIMMQTATGTLSSAIILIIHNVGHEGKRVSPLVRRLFCNVLARLFFVPPPPQLDEHEPYPLPYTTYSVSESKFSIASLQDTGETSSKVPPISPDEEFIYPPIRRRSALRDRRRKSRLSIPTLASLIQDGDAGYVRRRFYEGLNERDLAFAEYEWIAAVLDRVMLTVTLAGVGAITVATLAVGYGHMMAK